LILAMIDELSFARCRDAEAGQKDKAEQIGGRAFEVGKTIEDNPTKDIMLMEFATEAAAVGRDNQALAITKTLKYAKI